MDVNYSKLFDLLKKRKISKTKLAKDLKMSSTTLAKLSKGEYVSLKLIGDIVNYLQCDISDVLFFEKITKLTPLLDALLAERNIKMPGGIYHTTQIKLTYNSNHIEGSTLTEEQTRNIFETSTFILDQSIVNVNDIIETTNHFKAFDYILDVVNEELTEDIIKQIHLILKINTSDSKVEWFKVGEYKQKQNMVGDTKTSSPKNVENDMKKLLFNYNMISEKRIEDIIDFHQNFEIIHPFQDSNGRVGRLIIFKECLKYGIVPFIIDETLKLFYYRGLKEYNTEKRYLVDTCLTAQDKYKKILDYFEIVYED